MGHGVKDFEESPRRRRRSKSRRSGSGSRGHSKSPHRHRRAPTNERDAYFQDLGYVEQFSHRGKERTREHVSQNLFDRTVFEWVEEDYIMNERCRAGRVVREWIEERQHSALVLATQDDYGGEVKLLSYLAARIQEQVEALEREYPPVVLNWYCAFNQGSGAEFMARQLIGQALQHTPGVPTEPFPHQRYWDAETSQILGNIIMVLLRHNRDVYIIVDGIVEHSIEDEGELLNLAAFAIFLETIRNDDELETVPGTLHILITEPVPDRTPRPSYARVVIPADVIDDGVEEARRVVRRSR